MASKTVGGLQLATNLTGSDAIKRSPRKVPGGFDHADDDDLSPTKSRFDKVDWDRSASENYDATEQNTTIPSLNMANLPALPPADSSILHPYSDMNMSDQTLDEQAMRRHLGDIESSFIPSAPSPLGAQGGRGSSFLDEYKQSASKDSAGDNSPTTDANSFRTSFSTRAHTPDREERTAGDTTSSLETMSSSPTTAAAARTVSRAISLGSINNAHSEDDTQELTPKKSRRDRVVEQDSSDERSTIRNQDSINSLDKAARDVGSTPGHALLRRTSSRRPKYLRDRQGSQRSSVSSFLTDSVDEHSDHNLAADYALQSGGALPALGSRNSSYQLSRQVSLGSIASGFENDFAKQYDPPLATLEERSRPSTANNERPETPRAPTIAAPTDTVIARHVKNVQVPDSMAKEYADRNRSPSKSSYSLGRNGKNMTLKEQSSSIERLSKENFDLKLKVMFLSDRLDKLSEEGVKETISENVELKTALANLQRDNKALRKKNKELESQRAERPPTAKSPVSDEDRGLDDQDREELFYLRERVEEYTVEIERLRSEAVSREAEKRRMAETVRSMDRSTSFEVRDEVDVWKQLLDEETGRREVLEDENRKLKDVADKLRYEMVSGGLSHTTNIYNITKKRQMSPSRQSEPEERNTFSAASTLVDDLRRESEQLRHENAELRREVGAQTSMLTSRNQEKDRLYQEIEDLKLMHRRGGSVAGDSILERSASRAHERVNIDDIRDEYESQTAELRDKINDLRLKNQELQQQLTQTEQDFEGHLEQTEQLEAEFQQLGQRASQLEQELQVMQQERNEALEGQNEVEAAYEQLQAEASEEIKMICNERDELAAHLEKLDAEIQDKTENFDALQAEMRAMSEGLLRLEDDQDAKMRRIQELENEVEHNNREYETLQSSLKDAEEKVERLQVQQETSQNEIGFLRNEQESTMVKIGELEFALAAAGEKLRGELQHVQDLEQQLQSERKSFETARGKDKDKVHLMINNLNAEVQAAKDETRSAQKKAHDEQRESAAWKARLQELERNLGAAMGDLHGTRANLLQSVEKLQREMESTSRELEATRHKLNEKDRLVRQRDQLLEAHGLEVRKLVDVLDKEKQSHRNTKQQFDSLQRQQQQTSRTISQQESRMLELETSRAADRKKLTALETSFRDQLAERNDLLLVLWTRLSAICGQDWAHGNSLINGRALPTMEAISTMLPGFRKNLLAAIKTIESIVSTFKQKIKDTEVRLSKDLERLETALEAKSKRIDRLENTIKLIPSSNNHHAKNNNISRTPSRMSTSSRTQTLTTHPHPHPTDLEDNIASSPSPTIPTGPRHSSDQQGQGGQSWLFQKRELERRLAVEREGRVRDRKGAQERLADLDRERNAIRAELERERARRG